MAATLRHAPRAVGVVVSVAAPALVLRAGRVPAGLTQAALLGHGPHSVRCLAGQGDVDVPGQHLGHDAVHASVCVANLAHVGGREAHALADEGRVEAVMGLHRQRAVLAEGVCREVHEAQDVVAVAGVGRGIDLELPLVDSPAEPVGVHIHPIDSVWPCLLVQQAQEVPQLVRGLAHGLAAAAKVELLAPIGQVHAAGEAPGVGPAAIVM
mmetsp:Transcript_9790/g.25351  ORF Transcript_9790/g.25351 Transcript_9790/m.25351 type:complete len:210 (+) Transcript_9790:1433-2062(+)